MKKIILTIAVAVLAIGATAQTPVFTFGANSPIPVSYIPAAFMANQQLGVATVTLNFDEPINSSITVYNNLFQQVGSPISLPVTTISGGARRGEYQDPNSGQWVIDWFEDGDNGYLAPAITPYVEVGNSGIEAISVFAISQALFNGDEDFEYLQPVVTNVNDTDTWWSYREINGEYQDVQYREIYPRPYATGFNVVKPGGSVVTTITLPNGYKAPALADDDFVVFGAVIAKVMGNHYLVVPAENQNVQDEMESVKVFVYSLTQGSGVAAPLVSELPMSVFPTMVNKGGDVTVDLGENNSAREIRVIDQTGRVVKTQTVPAGQNQVKVNTSNINQGVNFINALCGRQQSSYKIVVR